MTTESASDSAVIRRYLIASGALRPRAFEVDLPRDVRFTDWPCLTIDPESDAHRGMDPHVRRGLCILAATKRKLDKVSLGLVGPGDYAIVGGQLRDVLRPPADKPAESS